jgi:hypothetical protein
MAEEDRFRTSSTHSRGQGTAPCATTSVYTVDLGRAVLDRGGHCRTVRSCRLHDAPCGRRSTRPDLPATTHPPQSTQLVHLLLNACFGLLGLPLRSEHTRVSSGSSEYSSQRNHEAISPTEEEIPNEREAPRTCWGRIEERTRRSILTQGASCPWSPRSPARH